MLPHAEITKKMTQYWFIFFKSKFFWTIDTTIVAIVMALNIRMIISAISFLRFQFFFSALSINLISADVYCCGDFINLP